MPLWPKKPGSSQASVLTNEVAEHLGSPPYEGEAAGDAFFASAVWVVLYTALGRPHIPPMTPSVLFRDFRVFRGFSLFLFVILICG